jgi:prolyl-tRNA editing enzyme YbaK/EbsC (Cys-tRNA(Pro) deacylase)
LSKSVARVAQALHDAGLPNTITEPGEARTAEMAALACGCALDQIVKSILFRGETSGTLYLFLTAGGNRICATKASGLAQEGLGRADAAQVRSVTGFAIGGVAPIGHLSAPKTWGDPRLMAFDTVYAAAGTPRHVFSIAPGLLMSAANAEIADFTQ